MRSKRKKRLRAIKRELVEPIYDKKAAAKLAVQEAALAAPKLPVKSTPTTAASDMDLTASTTSFIDKNTGTVFFFPLFLLWALPFLVIDWCNLIRDIHLDMCVFLLYDIFVVSCSIWFTFVYHRSTISFEFLKFLLHIQSNLLWEGSVFDGFVILFCQYQSRFSHILQIFSLDLLLPWYRKCIIFSS